MSTDDLDRDAQLALMQKKLDWLHWALLRISQARSLDASPKVDYTTGLVNDEPGREWPLGSDPKTSHQVCVTNNQADAIRIADLLNQADKP